MSDPARHAATQQRRIGAVILGTFALWIAVQFAASRLGWPVRWVALADLAALAALGWAVVMAVGLWRTRKE
ncbi:DUF5337 domain-containing protein [Jannaschia sp. W003]|uniref:DUF5337 domain-containing protein n=1 Tax=Jannaschia sp. W003 TaxID=2867012 RepID=UPI0021A62D95|nr:DUF5337 domain-containing protein [Jannaschia sp. W003]UWQ22832.1 DUF5337 domain-containing protein [Jannaschia sp. W003]